MTSVEGRWALVTGASRGVGVRVAKALAEKGCRLILHARTIEGTDEIARDLSARGSEVHQVAAELIDDRQVEAMIGRVKEITGGKLDILYNNAAVNVGARTIFTIPARDYLDTFKVNTIAPIRLCDAFLPGMLEQGWGRIVNVSSGIADQPELMAYSCSKAALDRYVRDMIPSLEGTGVLMNLLDPGWLRTDMGGGAAPNDPDTVIPGAMVPVLLESEEGSGRLYAAQNYRKN